MFEGKTEGNIEHREENSSRRIFIELGAGAYALPWISERQFNENEIYIGVDINKDTLTESKKIINDIKPVDNIFFIQADAKQLPIKDESADEIFLGNLLGEPRINNEDKRKFMEEAYRILKNNGQLVIKETYSPPEWKELDEILKGLSFKVERFLRPADKEWSEEMIKYQRTDKISGGEYSYVLYLKKIIPGSENSKVR